MLALTVILLFALQAPRRPSEDEPVPAATQPRRSAWTGVFSLLPLLMLLATVWYPPTSVPFFDRPQSNLDGVRPGW